MADKYGKSEPEIKNGLSELYDRLSSLLGKNPNLFIERSLGSLKFGRQVDESDELTYEVFFVEKTEKGGYNIEYTSLEKTAKSTFSSPITKTKDSDLLKKLKEKVSENIKGGYKNYSKKEKEEFETLVLVEESTDDLKELGYAFEYISKALDKK